MVNVPVPTYCSAPDADENSFAWNGCDPPPTPGTVRTSLTTMRYELSGAMCWKKKLTPGSLQRCVPDDGGKMLPGCAAGAEPAQLNDGPSGVSVKSNDQLHLCAMVSILQ